LKVQQPPRTRYSTWLTLDAEDLDRAVETEAVAVAVDEDAVVEARATYVDCLEDRIWK
jgi:hypothetical protein